MNEELYMEKQETSNSDTFFSIIKKIWYYYKEYKSKLIISSVFAVIGSLVPVLGPYIIAMLVDYIRNGLIGQIDTYSALKYIIILFSMYIIMCIASSSRQNLLTIVTEKVTQNIRRDVYEKIHKLPMTFFHNNKVGDMISRIVNDVEIIGSQLSFSIVDAISEIILFIGCIIMMIYISVPLTLTVIFTSIIGFIIIAQIMIKGQKYFDQQQKDLGNLNGYTEEMYSNRLLIKAFSNEEKTKSDFDEFNSKLQSSNYMAVCFSGVMQPLMGFVNNLGYVAVCIVGAILVFYGNITFGVIISFLIYASNFTSPLMSFAQIIQVIQLSVASGKRVFEVMEYEEVPTYDNKLIKLDSINGKVDFENISFGYDRHNEEVIKDLSAYILPSQKVAVVGPTGSGKTTLINLLLKFYDITKGKIEIDGHPISEINSSDVRNQFCVVLQDTFLFEGTIRENIVYTTKNVEQSLLEHVCDMVGLDYLIRTLPNGYDTVINDKMEISEGQKQQISIARAMLTNRSMLILDEATSSVDTRLEVLIHDSMDRLLEGKTALIIAHRLSTIKNADLILVMKDGKIIESGTHYTLLEQDGLYKKMYISQFKS